MTSMVAAALCDACEETTSHGVTLLLSHTGITQVQGEGLEGHLSIQGADEALHHQPDDTAQAETVASIGPRFLNHLRITGGHVLLLMHLVQVTDEGPARTQQRKGSMRSQTREGRLRRSLWMSPMPGSSPEATHCHSMA